MRRMIVLNIAALLFLFGQPVFANTIYTWTDADGVKRYSNSQPPDDAENVQAIQEIQYDQHRGDQSRQKYNRMVEDASRSADQHFKEQAQKKVRNAKAKREQQQEKQARQIESELAKLQNEIDDLNGRGLSPTFSSGQKEHLIKQAQEKINTLKRNTD